MRESTKRCRVHRAVLLLRSRSNRRSSTDNCVDDEVFSGESFQEEHTRSRGNDAFVIVAERMQYYTKREIERATVAREHQTYRMCFPTSDQLKKILAAETNFPFTAPDVDAADFIFGKSNTAMQGRELHRKRLNGTPIEKPRAQQRDITIAMDIVKADGVSFLVGITPPMNHLMAVDNLSVNSNTNGIPLRPVWLLGLIFSCGGVSSCFPLLRLLRLDLDGIRWDS